VKQNYGERLATAIRLKNIKQADIARKLGITQATVSKIINGTQYLDFDLAVKTCEILEISLDWLAYGLDKEINPPYYRNPERQRIEYLLSLIRDAEYPLVIVAIEEIIEIRLKKAPPNKTSLPNNRKKRTSKQNILSN
jgi:transcriptional regulator with XRE-family HTH domain